MSVSAPEPTTTLLTGSAAERARRADAWRACDAISAEGKKPALRSVREKGVKGSDPAVQAHIKEWYEYVFEKHHASRTLPGVPPEIAEFLIEVYNHCSRRADAEFTDARQRLEEEAERQRTDADALRQRLQEQEGLIAGRDRTIAEMQFVLHDTQAQLAGARTEIHDLLSRLSARERHFQERREALEEAHRREIEAERKQRTEEAARLQEDHRQRLEEVRVEFQQRENALSADIDRLRRALDRVEEQYHALRSEWAAAVEAARKAQSEVEKAKTAHAESLAALREAKAEKERLERRVAEREAEIAREIERPTSQAPLRTGRRGNSGKDVPSGPAFLTRLKSGRR